MDMAHVLSRQQIAQHASHSRQQTHTYNTKKMVLAGCADTRKVLEALVVHSIAYSNMPLALQEAQTAARLASSAAADHQ